MWDPTPWRSDTPAALAGRIHLNNAGAGLMPMPVVEAIRQHLDREVQLGGYEAAGAAAGEIDQAYDDVAALLNTASRNVAVVENATVAFAQALSAFDFAAGDVILTTDNDYISNQLMYLSLQQRRGVRVVRAADLPAGGVDPQSVRELIARERPALVAVTWIPTNSGLVQPVAEVGDVCAAAGVPYLVDACQAVGQVPIDVDVVKCDFLSGTARKFLRGPRGVGFLYVSDRMLGQGRAPLYVDMRGARWTGADSFALVDSARRFENWEFAWSLVLGMGAAARYAMRADVGQAGAYAASLAARTRTALDALPGARVLDHGAELGAIVTVELEGQDVVHVADLLREQAINVSTTHAEHAIIDMERKAARSALRISPHYYNTARELDILTDALLVIFDPAAG